jgi:hypothetical protein
LGLGGSMKVRVTKVSYKKLIVHLPEEYLGLLMTIAYLPFALGSLVWGGPH